MAWAPPASTIPVTPARCAAARIMSSEPSCGSDESGVARTISVTPATCAGIAAHEDARGVAGFSAGRVDADPIERADAQAEGHPLVLEAKTHLAEHLRALDAVEAADPRRGVLERLPCLGRKPGEGAGAVEFAAGKACELRASRSAGRSRGRRRLRPSGRRRGSRGPRLRPSRNRSRPDRATARAYSQKPGFRG